MKKIVALIALVTLVLIACQPQTASQKTEITKESLKTKIDKVAYALGLQMGKQFKKDSLAINKDIYLKAISDGMSGDEKSYLMNETELREVMTTFQNEMRTKMMAQRKADMEKKKAQAPINKKAGEEFLAQNKTKPGIKTTKSGLQYKVITEGKGKKPQLTDVVKVHYKGTTIKGKEFDSSYKRGQPTQFPLNGVIKGWTEGLQLMTVGSKYQLFIPSNLAYAERGAGVDIGPNETLIFEVELLEIVEKKAPAPKTPPAAKKGKKMEPKKAKKK